jgi:hypothetical protein
MSLLCALVVNHAVAADKPDLKALMVEADRHMYGQGVPQNRGIAAQHYEKGCVAGAKAACAELTEILYWGHPLVPKDTQRAVRLMQSLIPYLTEACGRNEARACLRLSAAFADGIGIQQDRMRAAELDKKACDGGFLEGCFFLGVAYAKGKGVVVDHGIAAVMYQKSCEGGYAAGCAKLSGLHAVGQGVSKDMNRALELSQKACSLGFVASCDTL